MWFSAVIYLAIRYKALFCRATRAYTDDFFPKRQIVIHLTPNSFTQERCIKLWPAIIKSTSGTFRSERNIMDWNFDTATFMRFLWIYTNAISHHLSMFSLETFMYVRTSKTNGIIIGTSMKRMRCHQLHDIWGRLEIWWTSSDLKRKCMTPSAAYMRQWIGQHWFR